MAKAEPHLIFADEPIIFHIYSVISAMRISSSFGHRLSVPISRSIVPHLLLSVSSSFATKTVSFYANRWHRFEKVIVTRTTVGCSRGDQSINAAVQHLKRCFYRKSLLAGQKTIKINAALGKVPNFSSEDALRASRTVVTAVIRGDDVRCDGPFESAFSMATRKKITRSNHSQYTRHCSWAQKHD